MKKHVYIFLILVLFFSCTPQTYYQLFETKSDDLKQTRDELIFENEDIQISYNFWADKGNGTFVITNLKTKDIFIDLKRSHLIINDVAFTYFQNRSYTIPKIPVFSYLDDEEIKKQRNIQFAGITQKKVSKQSSEVVIFNEERFICIPPKSSQKIFGFNLQSNLYRDCNLLRFPRSEEIIYSEFSSDNTPLKYRNRISYGFSELNASEKQIENIFWVSKITNYSEKEFINYSNLKFCQDSSLHQIKVYPYKKETSFFYKYKLEPGRINH